MLYQMLKPYIKNQSKRVLKRNEVIYHEGDHAHQVYFIDSGIVGLFHISSLGKETFLRVFGENDILGHRSYFAQEVYHASATALSTVELTVISQQECKRICQHHPELIEEILRDMAIALGKAELRMAGLLDKSAYKRISESLVYLKLKHPSYVWTRKEIGEYSGSTFETVTRVMTILEKKNLIKKQGRDFIILNQKALLSISEDHLN